MIGDTTKTSKFLTNAMCMGSIWGSSNWRIVQISSCKEPTYDIQKMHRFTCKARSFNGSPPRTYPYQCVFILCFVHLKFFNGNISLAGQMFGQVHGADAEATAGQFITELIFAGIRAVYYLHFMRTMLHTI